ncbi:MAG: hypothetical protein EOO70_09835 [Myxococcaceae bacterium]|nr:MAG: hypothetical protein EOO70_09835 [Myxococcaceae bacterium]
MKKTLSSIIAGAMLAMLGVVGTGAAVTSAEARGCTWYIYQATKNTTYWENPTGSQVNGGFWKHPSKGTKFKTNVPFGSKARTPMKYQIWNKKWQKLSLTSKFPYINKGAVRYVSCY